MMQQMFLGYGGSGDATYIDDIFSTFLWPGDGNNSRNIANGIDLSGEGGLVWLKSRTTSESHNIFDTVRGAEKAIFTESTSGEGTYNNRLTAFNSNGFRVNGDDATNKSGTDYVAWTFRKCPGFFDVVTYNGNSTNRQIAHNLGSVPGMIIIKALNKSSLWRCYHRSLSSADYVINLNQSSDEADSGDDFWNSTHPTASVFTLGDQGNVNETGSSYVAYLFAHNDGSFGESSNEAVIKCGVYTGNGSSSNIVNLGFEPQWLLVKNTQRSTNWHLWDVMRGMSGQGSERIYPNTNDDEEFSSGYGIQPLATGFEITASGTDFNANTEKHIYVAIRRPHKPPSAATEVFAIDSAYNASPAFDANFPADLILQKNVDSSNSNYIYDRLTIGQLETNSTAAKSNAIISSFQYMNGWGNDFGYTDATEIAWMFKRAKGFFDLVAYKGTGSNKTESHNLSVIPEMIIVKKRSSSAQWCVYHSATGNTGITQFTNDGTYTPRPNYWNSTTPTSTQFSLGSEHDVNDPSDTFIAYLFATLPGISKVGSYTSDGNARDVDCGFTGGARFVLIKRTDSSGNWIVYDISSGINSGNDPYIRLNSSQAETTDEDHIDPLSSGFTVTTHSDVNTNGGTYIFLAIA
tara:strand:+ start:453 stop:2348 length:1896 start_codon:yes stop_codon:yes gene_type:complete